MDSLWPAAPWAGPSVQRSAQHLRQSVSHPSLQMHERFRRGWGQAQIFFTIIYALDNAKTA